MLEERTDLTPETVKHFVRTGVSANAVLPQDGGQRRGPRRSRSLPGITGDQFVAVVATSGITILASP